MNITPVIEAFFALLAAVVTAVVIPYIKSRTTAQQQAEIDAWVRIAVTAAEGSTSNVIQHWKYFASGLLDVSSR